MECGRKVKKIGVTNMFKNTKVFNSFSVNNLQKAKEFYGRTLGLEVSEPLKD